MQIPYHEKRFAPFGSFGTDVQRKGASFCTLLIPRSKMRKWPRERDLFYMSGHSAKANPHATGFIVVQEAKLQQSSVRPQSQLNDTSRWSEVVQCIGSANAFESMLRARVISQGHFNCWHRIYPAPRRTFDDNEISSSYSSLSSFHLSASSVSWCYNHNPQAPWLKSQELVTMIIFSAIPTQLGPPSLQLFGRRRARCDSVHPEACVSSQMNLAC